MSAFLCSNLHTVACAYILARQNSENPTIESTAAFARALRKVNNRALKCRYGDKPEYLPRDISAAFAAAAEWINSNGIDAWDAIATCFMYQCSEGDTEQMREWVFVDELQRAIPAQSDYRRAGIWSI